MKRIGFQTRCLPNGLQIAHVQTGPSCRFEVSIFHQVGSASELRNQSGTSHLLEHMMYRGSGVFSDSLSFSRALEGICGECNAYTSAETTQYWFQAPVREMSACLDLVKQFVLQPQFHDFELEKQIVIQEIEEDYNESGQCIDDYHLAMKALFGEEGLGLPVGGLRETLPHISLEGIRKHRNIWYRPDHTVVAVTSPEESSVAFSRIEDIFGLWAKPAEHHEFWPQATVLELPEDAPTRVVAIEHAESQFEARLTFAVPYSSSAQRRAYQILQHILDDGTSSRLQTEIREKKGLVYAIHAELHPYRDVFVFSICATVSPKNLEPTLQEIVRQIRNIKTFLVQDEELDRARRRFCFHLEHLEEDHESFLEEWVQATFFSGGYDLETEIEHIKRVSADELMHQAVRLFSKKRMCCVLVGPQARQYGKKVSGWIDL